MLKCDNNNKRQPDNQDTDTEEDIEIEDGDRQCTQQKVSILLIDLFIHSNLHAIAIDFVNSIVSFCFLCFKHSCHL